MRDYRRFIETQIEPRIGHLRLRDLRTAHITSMLREIHAEGLGATSTRRVHAVLRSALTDAVRSELVRSNAATHAIVVRSPRPKVRPWDPEDLGRFLDYSSADDYGPIFELMAASGLRRGEALGLHWADVDLQGVVVVVRQQVTQLDGNDYSCPACGRSHKGVDIRAPKTRSGEARRVDLGQHAIGVLLAHRLQQDQAKVKWADSYVEHDLVFPREDGNPIHPERVSKQFQRLVAASGLRRTRLQDLRHARASLLLASGTDISLVSKMLGHSSIGVTVDTPTPTSWKASARGLQRRLTRWCHASLVHIPYTLSPKSSRGPSRRKPGKGL